MILGSGQFRIYIYKKTITESHIIHSIKSPPKDPETKFDPGDSADFVEIRGRYRACGAHGLGVPGNPLRI